MYKIIAVDDEALALKRFEHIIGKEKRVRLLGSYTKPEEALEFIKNNVVDIAFLDIEMPGLSGLELAERIQEIDPYVSVVFITAFDQYALEAFKAHAVGYLLKPLDINDFSQQIDTLERSKQPRNASEAKKADAETDTSAAPLSVYCLGQFNCFLSSKPDTPISFRTAKTAELFALLIHHHKSPITKYHILDSLFPDMDYEKSNKLFYVSCSYLRSAFAHEDITNILLRENDSYRINTKLIDCDYIKFMEYSDRLNDLTINELLEAVSLYNGEYLMGRSYEWSFESKPYIDTLYQRIQFTLVDKLCSDGRRDEAYQTLNKYLTTSPLNEDVVSKLMTMYIQDNHKDMALQLYHNYETKLAEQLDTTPSAALKDIIR